MRSVTLFLAGDVMTGRGIDQALAHPGDPTLHEPGVHDARVYRTLAERAHGPIPRPLDPARLWGDALGVLARAAPAARIVNLETSITRSNTWDRAKAIHYRMHPANVGCLTAATIDVAVLANNHVLDWGTAGLLETLATLEQARIRTVGAGRSAAAAREPAIVPLSGGGRVVVIAVGSPTSGIPDHWQATKERAGIEMVAHLSEQAAAAIGGRAAAIRRPGDVTIVSIHWGSNWGHHVPEPFRRFAHRLVDEGIDIVHGHSSHHVRPVEVRGGRLILYGCGDLIDDYEGIAGYGAFRPDLGVVYLPTLDVGSGRLLGLRMVPMRMLRFGLQRAAADDTRWLADTLSHTSKPLGCGVVVDAAGDMQLAW